MAHPKDWLWNSYGFYSTGKPGPCAPSPEWIDRESVKSLANDGVIFSATLFYDG